MIAVPGSGQREPTFRDIARNPASGLQYRRTPSATSAILDDLKTQPVFTFDDLNVSPLKSRGAPGVALADFDGDGDLDIYVTNGPGTSNSLFSNQWKEKGRAVFKDIGAQSGAAAIDQDSTGVCYGDIDNDGDEDLYVLGNGEPNRLFENLGNAAFADVTSAAAVAGGSFTATSCSFGDIDNDGYLDLVVANSWSWRTPIGLFVPWVAEEHNQLFRNLGNGRFQDVSVSSGIQQNDGFPPPFAGFAAVTWAVAMVDMDLDGDVDILMADDQGSVPQSDVPGGVDRGFFHFFENDGRGRFTDVTVRKRLTQPGGWMALDFGDFNCDGRLDFFASNFSDFTVASQTGGNYQPGAFPSRWYLGTPDGGYTAPPLGGLGATPFGWGTGIFDYDGDGDLDIAFHGGMDLVLFVDASNAGVVLANDGCTATFSRDAEALDRQLEHRRRNVQGMAVGDLDHNGYDDIVSVSSFDAPAPIPVLPVPNSPEPVVFGDAGFIPTFAPGANPGEFVFTGISFDDGTLAVELNSGTGYRTIQVDVVGATGLTRDARVNRDGFGAVITVTPQGRRAPPPTMRPVVGGSSYASQHSRTTTFGLGRARRATVEVLWPGGVKNRVYDVERAITVPEIPCAFDSEELTRRSYRRCVARSLRDLRTAGIIDRKERRQLYRSAIRAWRESRAIRAH